LISANSSIVAQSSFTTQTDNAATPHTGLWLYYSQTGVYPTGSNVTSGVIAAGAGTCFAQVGSSNLYPTAGYENLAIAAAFIASQKFLNSYKSLPRGDRRNIRAYGWYLNIQQPDLQLIAPISEKGLTTTTVDSYANIISQITVNASNPALVCKYKFLKNLFKLSINAVCAAFDNVDVLGEIPIINEVNVFTDSSRYYSHDEKNNCDWVLSIAPCSNTPTTTDTTEYAIVAYQILNDPYPCQWNNGCP
jgi:hypothetical protein